MPSTILVSHATGGAACQNIQQVLSVLGCDADGQPSEPQIRAAFVEVCADDSECTLELASNILSGNDDDANALDAAIAATDLYEIARIVHRLKGVMPLCGAEGLTAFCAYVDARARADAAEEDVLTLALWLADAIRQLNRTLQSVRF